MLFYHGTSEENWKKIQDEGILFGVRIVLDNDGNPSKIYKPDRMTYLARDIEEASMYGNVVLEVEYNPSVNPSANNFIEGCWQVRVYEPIDITKIRRIK